MGATPHGAVSALVVATWNVHGTVGLDGRRSLERIVRMLTRLDADVIALQEFAVSRGRLAAACTELEDRLGRRAIVHPTLDTSFGPFGNTVLTRLPVREESCLDLRVGSREPRSAIELRLDWNGAPMRLFATHLGLSSAERRAQSERLAQRIAGVDTPAILLGDLNEPRRRGSLAALEAQMALGSSPATFPSPCPVLRLDRILVTASLHASRHARRDVLARIASDHLPLVATVECAGRAPDSRDSSGEGDAAKSRRRGHGP